MQTKILYFPEGRSLGQMNALLREFARPAKQAGVDVQLLQSSDGLGLNLEVLEPYGSSVQLHESSDLEPHGSRILRVYWDEQDPENVGWACRMELRDFEGVVSIESAPLNNVDELRSAVVWATGVES